MAAILKVKEPSGYIFGAHYGHYGRARFSLNHHCSPPAVNKPAVVGTAMAFTCSPISIKGGCKITGTPGDNPAGWTLGFIQLKFIDTDWAYYRGKLNQDGSSFLQYSRPPPLPTGGCRDTLKVGGIFVDNNPGLDKTVVAAGASFPATMSAAFSDPPDAALT